jgi:hypothetical protein
MATLTILEPMSTGDVIDRAVRLYRRNFTPLVAIVAVPTLTGYIVSLMFWFGYTELLTTVERPGSQGVSGVAALMMGLGAIGYPVWFFVLLVTVSGLSRVIGDHVMLNEAITFRKCFTSTRRRLGDIFLMGLISLAIFFGLYILFSIVLVVLVMMVGVIIGLTTAAALPRWVAGGIFTIVVLAAISLGLFIILLLISRFVFLPQALMIEGLKAGDAFSRATRLGGGNWYKVGAILLFTYFVSFSLLAAMTEPLLAVLGYFGLFSFEFFLSTTWNVIYTAFNQVSNLLVLPISVISLTLLYFDSRVRKEAYDIELLARELAPGFYWQPPVQTSAFGYQMAVTHPAGRQFVQTSPLGLAGYRSPAAPRDGREDLRQKFDLAASRVSRPEEVGQASPSGETPVQSAVTGSQDEIEEPACSQCGAPIKQGAPFCMNCGRAL